MIYGNINEWAPVPENLKKCFEFAKNNDLVSFEKGKHEIDGEDFFVNIVEYETTTKEQRFWEAHRVYLDVHLMLDGEEQIDVNFIDNLEQKPFEEEKDFLPLEGEAKSEIVLNKGDFLVCYPNDGHRTAVSVTNPTKIKKAIFKVKI